MDMKEEEYWKQFENSGRIQDYLSFVSSTRQVSGEAAGHQQGANPGTAGDQEAACQAAYSKTGNQEITG